GGQHLVLNPWPYYLGGDTIICSDPERRTRCDGPGKKGERADRREAPVARTVADTREGRDVGDQRAAGGVRWVVVSHVGDWQELRGLPKDAGLERVVSTDAVDLYRVRRWRGLIVASDGSAVDSSSVVEPVIRADASGPAVPARPYAAGWLRG